MPIPAKEYRNASAMLPIVRVLAISSFAATSARVRPRAATVWYSGDRSAAPTKSHHDSCSHSPNRRSSQLERKTTIRVAKYVASTGDRNRPPSISFVMNRTRASGVARCRGSGIRPNRFWSSRPPERGNSGNPASTRLSTTPFWLEPNGIRAIVSGMWL